VGQLVVRLILATALAAVAAVAALGLVLHGLADRAHQRALAEADLSAVVSLVEAGADEEDLRRGIARTSAGRDGRLAVHLGGVTIGTSGDSGDVLSRPVGDMVVEVHLPEGPWIPFAMALLLAGGSIGAGVDILRTKKRLGAIRDDLAQLTTAAYRIGDDGGSTSSGSVAETMLLAAALDRLADRFAQAREHERRLTADLSHRLRTPLTALALDVGALDADDPAAEDVRRALATLNEEIDRLIRSSPVRETGPARCDVVAVVERRMAFWSALAEHSGRACTVNLPGDPAEGPATTALSDDDLAALVDGLVGNIFRYTPPGTALAVTVVRHAGWITLVVDDAGPGVANPDRALRRGASGSGSTGLGLDIARNAVAQTGGTIHIERSALGGARIRLRFGEAGAPHPDASEPRAWRLWGATP
jgi:signal transduction histidine kinase